MRKNMLSVLVLGLVSPALVAFAQTSQQSNRSGQWPFAGQDLSNTRSQPAEHLIGPANVNTLTPKWVFTTGGNVTATPTVAGNAVYVPDWAGNLYAIDQKTGTLLWSRTIAGYDGVAGAISRVSPAVHGEELILGDIESARTPHDGANVMAVDRATGALLWITQVDSHPAAIITGSPVVYANVVYQGVSSNEEGLAAFDPSYPCCSFRGSVVALDAQSGKLLWKTYTIPDNGGQPGGYSGGAVWQPPAIDPARGTLYIGTGNNYTAPESVLQCLAIAPLQSCFAADDYFDTAMSLDLKTGAVKWAQKHPSQQSDAEPQFDLASGMILWAQRVQPFDIWTVGCIETPKINCEFPSLDADFGGSGSNLLGNMVGFGQKSGIYWALNPDNGNVLWKTQVGPIPTSTSMVSLGIEWGTATDGSRIYAAIGNSLHLAYTLVPSETTITWGSWSALDVKTGKILWQTADPTSGTMDIGAASVANGVLYAGSFSGEMYALDSNTGKILWNFASGGSVIDGPSIVGDTVYWGSGGTRIEPGIANNKLYAFSPAAQGR